MPKNSFAEQINNAEVMLSGLQNNATMIARRGIDVELLVQIIASATATNNEQERLKASLKSKTAELNAIMTKLNKEMAGNKKIVKTDFAKEQWKEFGINDKR